ncbi:MAG: tripartite tricarboxylate transporter TctB family protein [Acetobacteraceae bacterium]|nr:tripartite tricarboxylate transporter TctB family protein [Acetobacteraceae bacterium]
MNDRAREPSSLWPDVLVGGFVLLLGALTLWQALVIPVSPLYGQVGPKVVPFVAAGGLIVLGGCLLFVALRGGWSWALEGSAPGAPDAAPANRRALGLLGAGLLANLALIGFLGFSLAATAQFVLVAAAFGSRRPLRDLVLALVLTLAVWFLFVEALGVNIGAGLLEGQVLRLMGREPMM